VFKKPLVAQFDTSLTPIVWIFSIAILMADALDPRPAERGRQAEHPT
jgi:hypothetical protein